MDDRGLTEALIVTSDYHVPRALALCKQVGIIACGKGSPSKPVFQSLFIHSGSPTQI